MSQFITRRKVLKSTAILGASALLPSAALSCANMPATKLGIALVGLGNYSTLQLGPALQDTTLCALRGIVTGSPEKAQKWQKEYNILPQNTYNYDTFHLIKNNPLIDIVYIVLPNSMHAEYTIKALEAGKHVICEKPMGMNAAECKTMIAAAQKAGKKLQIGYRLFYEPHHLEMMRWAQEPHQGRIKMMESSLGFDMARPGLWRIDPKMGGGGALMDLGPYTIQAARRAVGQNPVSVQAQGFVDDPNLYKGIYGTYTWQLHFADNTVCNTTVSFSAYVDRFHVAKGYQFTVLEPAFTANAKLSLRTRDNTRALEVPTYQQTTQMDAFARNILDDTPVVASGEAGLIDMQIVDAIKKSLETGGRVEIEY